MRLETCVKFNLSTCAYNGLEIIVGQASLTVMAYTKMPEIGNVLQCKQDRGNLEDVYTVTVMKGETLSFDWPDSKSCRGIIACSASDNVCASGHTRIGDI